MHDFRDYYCLGENKLHVTGFEQMMSIQGEETLKGE